MKPENAGEEATGKSTRRAFRGGWGQRAWKDQSRSLGGPAGWKRKRPTGGGKTYIESRLEGKFQLEINREKTRVVDLREPGASLDFLGYTFRYDRDLKGRHQRSLK